MERETSNGTLTVIMLILTLLLIGFFAVLFIVVKDTEKATKQTFDHASQYFGKKIRVGNDSLMIIDYSLLTNTYVLSNGATANAVLIERLVK